MTNIRRTYTNKNGLLVTEYEIDVIHEKVPRLKELLNFLYHDQGIGFKLLTKLFDNSVSYTQLRRIFVTLGIEKRNGTSCTTHSLKLLRSENAISKGIWKNWTEKYQTKDKLTKHYLGGWYLNESTKKYVWLRSSWEFGYANWLNSNAIEWQYEESSYLLKNGLYYRPDFFIYVNGSLSKVVEIKATWNHGALDRIEKYYQFKQEYSNVHSEIITEELFDIIDIPYNKVLAAWKKIRKLDLPYDN